MQHGGMRGREGCNSGVQAEGQTGQQANLDTCIRGQSGVQRSPRLVTEESLLPKEVCLEEAIDLPSVCMHLCLSAFDDVELVADIPFHHHIRAGCANRETEGGGNGVDNINCDLRPLPKWQS